MKDVDIVSVAESQGGLDVVSRWSIRLLETGADHVGFCNNRWLLDRSGRKVTGGQSFCGLLPSQATLISS